MGDPPDKSSTLTLGDVFVPVVLTSMKNLPFAEHGPFVGNLGKGSNESHIVVVEVCGKLS